MQEKFSGIRAFWDGASKLSATNGQEIQLGLVGEEINQFYAGMPKIPLDGELW